MGEDLGPTPNYVTKLYDPPWEASPSLRSGWGGEMGRYGGGTGRTAGRGN